VSVCQQYFCFISVFSLTFLRRSDASQFIHSFSKAQQRDYSCGQDSVNTIILYIIGIY